MDAGLSPTVAGASRSRAARRAAAQRSECAATAALNVLGQKWVMRIIRVLGDRTQRLKMLEDEGLIERHAISAVPPWVEYSLTPKGADLRGAIAGIDRWADRWSPAQ